MVLCQQEQVVTEPQHEGLETCVPILFAIPFSAPESSRLGDDGEIVWHLEVWARLPGIDYAAKFKVPVFKTADSREDFQSEETDAARIVPSASNELVLRDAGIIREEMPDGGVRLTFRAARNWKSALFISIFPLVFGPVAFAILKFDKDAANLLNVPRIWQRADTGLVGFAVAAGRTLLVVVIGLTAAVILIGITVWALDLWLYRSVVEASQRELTVRGGWLGIGRTRSFAEDDIRQFKTQEYMSSSSGSVWKSIVVVPKAGKGKKCAVGKGIASKLAQRSGRRRVEHRAGAFCLTRYTPLPSGEVATGTDARPTNASRRCPSRAGEGVGVVGWRFPSPLDSSLPLPEGEAKSHSALPNRIPAGFTGADADRIFERRNEDFAVADLAVCAALTIVSMAVCSLLSSTTTSTFTLGTKSTRYSVPRYISVWPFCRPKPRTSVMVMPVMPFSTSAFLTSSSLK